MAVPYKYTTVRLFQLLVIFQVVFSRPNGAPTSSCTSLRPTHGAALTARNPFWLDVRNAANGRLRIQLQSSDRSAFQGFILQARGIVSNAPLGTFTGLPTGSKAMRCTNDGDTATHTDTEAKFNLVFFWTSPESFEGDIVFLVTVAENYADYWFRIASKQVPLPLQARRKATSSPEIAPTTPPESSTYVLPGTEILTELLPDTDFLPGTEFPTYIIPDGREIPTDAELLTEAPTEYPTYFIPDGELPTDNGSFILPEMELPLGTELPLETELPLGTQLPLGTEFLPASELPTYIVPDTTELSPVTEPTAATETATYIITDTELPTEPSPSTLPPTKSLLPTTIHQPETEQSSKIPTTQFQIATDMVPQNTPQTAATEAPTGTREQGTPEQGRIREGEQTLRPKQFLGKTYSAEFSIDAQFDAELNDNRSKKFQDLAATLKTQIENVYKKANESVEVKVLQFRPDNFVVKLTLAFDMEMKKPLYPLQEAVKDGRLGSLGIVPSSIKLTGENICMSNPCHKNATCFETSGSFMCKCRSGFIGDGILCAVITPVAAKQESSKDENLIKNLLIASLAIVGIILIVVLISLVIILHRIVRNNKSETTR